MTQINKDYTYSYSNLIKFFFFLNTYIKKLIFIFRFLEHFKIAKKKNENNF